MEVKGQLAWTSRVRQVCDLLLPKETSRLGSRFARFKSEGNFGEVTRKGKLLPTAISFGHLFLTRNAETTETRLYVQNMCGWPETSPYTKLNPSVPAILCAWCSVNVRKDITSESGIFLTHARTRLLAPANTHSHKCSLARSVSLSLCLSCTRTHHSRPPFTCPHNAAFTPLQQKRVTGKKSSLRRPAWWVDFRGRDFVRGQ